MTPYFRPNTIILCFTAYFYNLQQEVFPIHSNRKQRKSEMAALRVSLTGNCIFVILELIMAVYTSSQTVLLDSIYDTVELAMIFISMSLVPLLYKPSNEKRPFGYLQVESLFVVLKGIVMIAVTLGLIVNNVQIIFHGGRHVNFSTVAYFELFATLLGILFIIILNRKNRNLTSPIVTTEIQEWKIDTVSSIGMTAAFFLPALITAPWLDPIKPYLDQMIAIALSVFMLPTPIKSVVTGLRDLFLLPPEEETVDEIKSIIVPILDDYGYDHLYFDIVRTGRKLWISVYITFDRDLVSISRFRLVQNDIIQALSKHYQDFYFELLPDIKYSGTTEVEI